MDTPEKTQIATPLSKFEDSPVFNYINSLSPIQPVKSIPITLTFNPLGFSSLPPIFTSPHVSSHKESRFLRRHNDSDLSKREISSETRVDVDANEGVATGAHQPYDNSASMPADFDPVAPVEEAALNLSREHPRFAIELPQTLRYDRGSPECDPTRTKSASELVGNTVSVQNGSSEGCMHVLGTCQTEQQNEVTGCDWDSMINDAAGLLFFNSPGDSEALKGLFKSPFQPSTMIEGLRMPITGPSDSGEQIETGDQSPQSGETINQTQGNLATTNQKPNGEGNDEDGKPESNLHRGLRRRCLHFEMVGSRRRNLNDGSKSNYNGKIASKDKQVVSTGILPGIGLHLNALTVSSNKPVKNERITSGKPDPNFPSSTASFYSPTMGKQFHESFATATVEKGEEPIDNGVQLAEDTNEEFNQNSPKKKRRKMEQPGESESCKRCNCKKSKCLKLYCECFAAGVYCIEPCACQDCFNKPIYEDTVLATRKQIESRNPLAFAPKVIRGSDSVPELVRDDSSKTPASARHKRGCNCKKSSCLKKYCECYQGGVGCSINCRCETCMNIFGRKNGSVPTETEEAEEDETETCDKVEKDKAVQKTEIPSTEKQNMASAFPITPLQLSRSLVQHPFSSKNKPSLLLAGSSSMLYNGQKLGKSNFVQSQSKFEKRLETVPEDEMPEILQDNCSPGIPLVKSASPNGKRITPPFLGVSLGLRSSRKLILQSIPSFPSLTPKH